MPERFERQCDGITLGEDDQPISFDQMTMNLPREFAKEPLRTIAPDRRTKTPSHHNGYSRTPVGSAHEPIKHRR